MSGIVGNISFKQDVISDALMDNSLSLLKHRGNDKIGKFKNKICKLGVTNSAQENAIINDKPFTKIINNKKIVIICNAEIYNRDQLKKDLNKLGYIFNTQSDSELILNCYLEYKESCLKEFNGVFSFIIYDERYNTFFIARDRLGVKPLFYSIINDEYMFASEIKALLVNTKIKPQMDKDNLYEMLFLGPARTIGATYFKNVFEIKPATYAVISHNQINFYKYWQLHDKKWEYDFDTTVNMVNELVSDAINIQLDAKDKNGVLLSGGLDSSIVSCVAKNKISNLKTYSVDFKDNDIYFKKSLLQGSQDRQYIDKMVNTFNLDHKNIEIDNNDLIKYLNDVVRFKDMPGMVDIDASLYLFANKMKQEIDVALSGECADEIFGGYPWYYNPQFDCKDKFPWSKDLDVRKRFIKEEFIVEDIDNYIKNKVNNTYRGLDVKDKHDKDKKRLMKLNLDWFMLTLVDRCDRMTMASSLNVRVPFCDYRIVEMLYQIPWEFKYKNDTEKFLLRKAFDKQLPYDVVYRKKCPYPKTYNPIYRNKLNDILENIIKDDDALILKIIKKSELKKLINCNDDTFWYGQLMNTAQTIAYFIQIDFWLNDYNVEIISPKGKNSL